MDDYQPKVKKAKVEADDTMLAFGSDVLEPLDWKLKEEKDRKEGKKGAVKLLTVADHQNRAVEVRDELHKLKQQREERALEKQRWEEEHSKAQRGMNDVDASYHLKEDEFYLQQTRLKAQKRISEKRGGPLDSLYCVVHFAPDFPLQTTVPPPSKLIRSLPKSELEKMAPDIELFSNLDVGFKEFWKAVLLLIEFTLKKVTGQAEDDGAVHPAVIDDVNALFEDKSQSKLMEIEGLIRANLKTGNVIDEEYWHSLLKRLRFFYAKAKIDETHMQMVDWRINELRKTGVSEETLKAIREKFFAQEAKRETNYQPSNSAPLHRPPETIISPDGATLGGIWYTGHIRSRKLTDDEMYRMEAAKGESHHEQKFSREIELEGTVKDGLRKPKYYNRVIMGVDWNKYNIAHYDEDTPPPKTVQGYQFNIFYPDLDTNKAPRYEIVPTENPDLVIIVFKSATPYHDLAFKIASGDWEYSQRKGFKSIFSNGILHLYFRYKKYRYRR